MASRLSGKVGHRSSEQSWPPQRKASQRGEGPPKRWLADSWVSSGCGHAPLALGIKRVIDDELAFQDFVVSQTESAESECDPTQAFAGRMRIRGMRISCADNFAKQDKRWVGQGVFLENGVE